MNLLVNGIDNPSVYYQDTIGSSFIENHPSLTFDIILANPPFKGIIDANAVDPTLSGKVKQKTGLFPMLMLRC